MTRVTRLAGFPDVPTVAEQGYPGFAVTEWLAMLAPAGTSPAILDRLAQAVAAALRDPAVRQRLPGLGMEPAGDGPAALARFLAEQRVKMAALIQAENIRLD